MQRLAQKDDKIRDTNKHLATEKAKATRLFNRAKAGVCPCCNRSFKNLRDHMKTEHKEEKVA